MTSEDFVRVFWVPVAVIALIAAVLGGTYLLARFESDAKNTSHAIDRQSAELADIAKREAAAR